MSARASVGPILLLAAILSWPGKLCAEEAGNGEGAVQLGHAGLALYQEGRWNEAFARFKQANATMNSPVFVLYMARCQRNLKLLREAAQQLEELLAREPAGDAPISWSNALRDGRAELEALRPSIPSVRILPKDLARVTVDDVPVRAGEVVQLNPGQHVVRGWSVGGRLATRLFTLSEGERDVAIALTFGEVLVPPLAPVGSPTSPLPMPQGGGQRENPWRTPAWIAGGVAVTSALVGTVTGLMAKSELDAIRQRCEGRVCPAELEGDAGHARLLANVSTAAFSIAGVDTALAVTFLLLPPWPTTEGQPDRR